MLTDAHITCSSKFVLPGMAGSEMATGRGHGEMEIAREIIGKGGGGGGGDGDMEAGGSEGETGRGQRLFG